MTIELYAKHFHTTRTHLTGFNGQAFTLLNEVHPGEIEQEEIGRMFNVELSTGDKIQAHEDEIINPELVPVRYITIWDGGREIKTFAKYEPATGLVHDITSSDADDLDILEDEYIQLPDGQELRVLEEDGNYRAFTDED